MDEALVSAVVHSQKIAQQIGAANMAVDVYGWAIKYAMSLPQPAFNELLDIIGKVPESDSHPLVSGDLATQRDIADRGGA